MFRRKSLTLMIASMMLAGLIAGCSSKANNEGSAAPSSSTPPSSSAATQPPASESPAADEIVDINFWYTNTGNTEIDKDSPVYNWYKEKIGVGVILPHVVWNGGTDYLNALNVKIAAGEMPNVFLPWGGNEAELAKNGALADLTDLLPKYAPHLWELVPENVWNIVKANDPTGQGRIYWVPAVNTYEKTTGLIRKDWLDKLGLQMPKTQEEYVNVLKAFKEKDPNGNGKADEIPTGGRADARWMDHLFDMYGVAMLEGIPDWDVYNGELTYSAVTQNAKDAIAFISKLYKDKLLDQETFLNDKAAWDGKISGNLVGNYFHWGQGSYSHLANIEKAFGIQADIAVLPVIEVPGYEGQGFITTKQNGAPQYVVKADQDEQHLMASLKFLDAMGNQDNWGWMSLGVEGMHYKVENGKNVLLPRDPNTMQPVVDPWNQFGTMEFVEKSREENTPPELKWQYDPGTRNMKESQQYVKVIAGDGMPSSIYDDYPDIKNRTLWNEYVTKIIIGTYSLDKFDEFVDKWNKSGGEEVTKRAREWYAKVGK